MVSWKDFRFPLMVVQSWPLLHEKNTTFSSHGFPGVVISQISSPTVQHWLHREWVDGNVWLQVVGRFETKGFFWRFFVVLFYWGNLRQWTIWTRTYIAMDLFCFNGQPSFSWIGLFFRWVDHEPLQNLAFWGGNCRRPRKHWTVGKPATSIVEIERSCLSSNGGHTRESLSLELFLGVKQGSFNGTCFFEGGWNQSSFTNVAWCQIMTPGKMGLKKIPTNSPERSIPQTRFTTCLWFGNPFHISGVPGVCWNFLGGKVAARWNLDDGTWWTRNDGSFFCRFLSTFFVVMKDVGN